MYIRVEYIPNMSFVLPAILLQTCRDWFVWGLSIRARSCLFVWCLGLCGASNLKGTTKNIAHTGWIGTLVLQPPPVLWSVHFRVDSTYTTRIFCQSVYIHNFSTTKNHNQTSPKARSSALFVTIKRHNYIYIMYCSRWHHQPHPILQ